MWHGFITSSSTGIPLAQNTIFIVVTMMLACFDFSPSLSEKAKMRYTQKLVKSVLHFSGRQAYNSRILLGIAILSHSPAKSHQGLE